MKNRIRDLRAEKGITQMDLANAIGVARSTVAGYEIGKSEPDSTVLNKLATFFDTSVDYLTGKSNEREAVPSVSDIDPQILRIMKIAKSISAEGLEKVVEYADLIQRSGMYPKRHLRM